MVEAARKVGALDQLDAAGGAEVCRGAVVPGRRGHCAGPVPLGEDDGVPGPITVYGPRDSVRRLHRAVEHSRDDIRSDIGCVDHMNHRVVGPHPIGQHQTRTKRRTHTGAPLVREDRGDAVGSGNIGRTENEYDVCAATVAQGRDRDGEPVVDKHFRHAVASAGARGEQHSDGVGCRMIHMAGECTTADPVRRA